jgi:para-aminobenzoate synthetase
MRTLLIDNYDSFTYNLFQLLAEVNGEEPIVVKNDEVGWPELREYPVDNIVISPGPGHPAEPRDFGVCAEVIRSSHRPILGVCLGHQGLCQVLGGRVGHAPEVMHGRLSDVFHDGHELFEGIPSPFRVVRYHSLVATDVPDVLAVTARTADGLVMGLRHTTRPLWGVQFHPESICTEHGWRLIENFRRLSEPYARPATRGVRPAARPAARAVPPREVEPVVHTRRLPFLPEPEQVYQTLFAEAEASFWLDSSAVIPERSRFSFMGSSAGLRGEYVLYDVARRRVTVYPAHGDVTSRDESVLEYLDRELRRRRCRTDGLPFAFNLGFVGYLGYELKADCGGRLVSEAATPDAALIFGDRVVAFDHLERCAYLLWYGPAEDADAAARWFDAIAEVLARLPATPAPLEPWAPTPLDLRLRHSRAEYLGLIGECQRHLRDGESYELCLTNQIVADVPIDPLRTYLTLRRLNPAPFAAFLKFPGFAVLCSSPERFLSCDTERGLEAKPIKGTIRRGRTPEEDRALSEQLATNEKDRAENLMIVDLLRNDLGVVCEVGSVHVPLLFAIESYATVHQLVSTVRGRLRPELSVVDAVRAAFPGGSMTGAPKRRTMEILDTLERGPRGVYSGSLGYFALNGAADLNIVIRTIVATLTAVSIGAGGAIIALSDPEAEFDETVLKARVLVTALETSAPAGAGGDEAELVGAAASPTGEGGPR